MVFDNSDGKIGGEYAAYNEVALRRAVSRDGTSDYFINGTKVRRKDITQLFLGTGLGTRSYAHHRAGNDFEGDRGAPGRLARVPRRSRGNLPVQGAAPARPENRIGHTRREPGTALNDVREEVDKQIRHLQRQAARAALTKTLKEEERKMQELSCWPCACKAWIRKRRCATPAALSGERRCTP